MHVCNLKITNYISLTGENKVGVVSRVCEGKVPIARSCVIEATEPLSVVEEVGFMGVHKVFKIVSLLLSVAIMHGQGFEKDMFCSVYSFAFAISVTSV